MIGFKLYKVCIFKDIPHKSDVRTGRMSAADETTFKGMLQDAQKDFEKAKELDPDQMTVKWGYLLKNIYTQTGQQEKADAIL